MLHFSLRRRSESKISAYNETHILFKFIPSLIEILASTRISGTNKITCTIFILLI